MSEKAGIARDDDGPDLSSATPLQQVEAALARLQFGTIQLTIHNGKLVQLDVTERQRFPLQTP